MNKIDVKDEGFVIRKEHYDELVNLWNYDRKVELAKKRIEEFLCYCDSKYNDHQEHQIIVSFSGGKDSTVLLDLVIKTFDKLYQKQQLQNLYLTIGYAYEITFPETIKFIKSVFQYYQERYPFVKKLDLEKPKLNWQDILQTKGFPIFSKEISVLLNRIKKVKSQNGLTRWIFGIDTTRFKLAKNRLFLLDSKMKEFPQTKIDKDYFAKTINNNDWFYSEKCCDYIKGNLKHLKYPTFVGTTTNESHLRKMSWLKYGCNILSQKVEKSRPISLFTTMDIWKYILKNKLNYNQKYGLKKYESCLSDLFTNQPKDNKHFYEIIEKLPYKRLGCISCPYGSHLEKGMNRFEVLVNENENLFKAQVIETGMYKVLIDMGIKINNENIHAKKYMELYYSRHQQIKKWYKNFDFNLARVIVQIENYKNYKQYVQKKNRNPCAWKYSNKLIKQIHSNYDVQIDVNQFIEIIKKLRKEILKNKTV